MSDDHFVKGSHIFAGGALGEITASGKSIGETDTARHY
jgi:hypothetical protein